MAFFNRKNKDQKKKGESIIGKIIYGFLLFAPLFNILVTCMYVTFNKNAYESYGQNQEQETIYTNITNASDLIIGERYNFNNTNIDLPNVQNQTIFSFFVDNININYTQENYINPSVKKITLYRIPNYTSTYTVMYTYDANNINLGSGTIQKSTLVDFDFNLVSISSATNYDNIFYQYIYTKTSSTTINSLDNAFVYGTEKTEESNLFNWSKTTGTYTVLQNVCNGIGITNTFTPMLMAYWLLISVIYFIYDIALILIWAVHDKIHELKDAI